MLHFFTAILNAVTISHTDFELLTDLEFVADPVKADDAVRAENIKKLKEKMGRAVQDAGHMQPFSESRHGLPAWHKKIYTLEKSFLESAGILFQRQ